ncbi:hypothetical protein BCV70DRAFT_103071 [Testicularia cyperi]|uniref:Phosphatases II n=1 Tax=Testicularia cyperi TaxID=1882483 RepID=A0A317XNR5_9BASI|nr:hypothetical protein BCV70DRAFT_103071 [Testicularia cyperi]
MMTTQSPQPSSATASSSSGRRLKLPLPSLSFGNGSASTSTQKPDFSRWQPSATTGAPGFATGPGSSTMGAPASSNHTSAEPDYFATAHVPGSGGGLHGANDGMRIASPFALQRSAETGSGASTVAATPAASTQDHGDSHPWAKLFGDGGMKTALPEGFQAGRMAVPPTPAANVGSVPTSKSVSGAVSGGVPPDLSSKHATAKFKHGMTSSNSLPIPSAASRARSQAAGINADLAKYKGLSADEFARMVVPPTWIDDAKLDSAPKGPVKIADDVLLLDIRPSTSFSLARINSSINICAPSTLLKRPGITVERIEDEMLGSASDRQRFMRWRKGPSNKQRDTVSGSTKDISSSESSSPKRGHTVSLPDEPGINKIIVLDTDTSRIDGAGNATAGGGGPCLVGMLKKFDAAGYAGELYWLVGGFNRLVQSSKVKHLIETGPLSSGQDSATDDDETLPDHEDVPRLAGRTVSSQTAPTLRLNGAAQGPVSGAGSLRKPPQKKLSLVQPRGLPLEAFQSQSTVAGWPGQAQEQPPQLQLEAGNNGRSQTRVGDNTTTSQIRPKDAAQPKNAAASMSFTGSRLGQALRGAASMARSAAACANPFFDNIRQNRELQHGITERIPMDLPSMSEAEIEALPQFLRQLVRMPQQERAQTLAEAFFEVEKAEQNRLIATMQQHSAESDQDPRSKGFARAQAAALFSRARAKTDAIRQSLSETARSHAFPFSIAAALERGSDNRYNNIWTYEHSRVRLLKPRTRSDPGSDYLNGSYVQPAEQFGSRRRYIATQAPLPTTFESFWTAVWEQGSRVIVMLTREHESGRIQSHPYWLQTEYGPSIRLELVEETVLDDAGKPMPAEDCKHVLGQDSAGGNSDSSKNDGGHLFPLMAPQESEEEKKKAGSKASTIRRTLRLRNLSEPNEPARTIVQLQYIAWPDYHIPDTPDSLLTLMDMADASQSAADAELRGTSKGLRVDAAVQRSPSTSPATGKDDVLVGPMVVHCSAGVGRTGAFIVIDAALDVIRRCRRRFRGLASPAAWDNDSATVNTSRTNASGLQVSASDTPDVEMLPSTSPREGRFPRTPRKSLKRELSPTGMEIDSGSDSRRDVSSPPPMLRSRSSESGGVGSSSADLHGTSWSSSSSSVTSSSALGTPARPFSSSTDSAMGESSDFRNPFSAQNFRFMPNAGGLGGRVGANGEASAPIGLQSPPRSSLPPFSLAPADAWRQAASSPYSEVSTPSLHSGSARSSFSSAAGFGANGAPHSRLPSNGLSPTPSESSRSIDGALAGMNPFELTLSQDSSALGATGSSDQGRSPSLSSSWSAVGSEQQDGGRGSLSSSSAAALGDASTSTITGSNEPTPFDASSSSDTFGFGSLSASGKLGGGGTRSQLGLSASQSGASSASLASSDATPNTSASVSMANDLHRVGQSFADSKASSDAASQQENAEQYDDGSIDEEILPLPPSSLQLPSDRDPEGRNRSETVALRSKTADAAYASGEDIIRKTVDRAREQRMSLIQTGRQFVFVYSAVLAGILREMRTDGVQ